jgi:hypothetical protein
MKFAAPVAPNKLPAEPLPKAEPISAPLPCWSKTREMIESEDRICTTSRRLNIQDIETLRKLNSEEKYQANAAI